MRCSSAFYCVAANLDILYLSVVASHSDGHSSANTSTALPVGCWMPTKWRDAASLSMKGLRHLLFALRCEVKGRATKVDLQYLVCQTCGISTAGDVSGGSPAVVRASILPEVIPFYTAVGNLSLVATSKNEH